MDLQTSINQKSLHNNRNPIAVIIPCFNEAEIIKDFLTALINQLQTINYDFKLIIIDDGSVDDSYQIIVDFKQSSKYNNCVIKIIQFSKNFGKEAALLAGLESIASSNHAATIIMDADFQHPINLIPIFLEYWNKGIDIVYGVRSNRNDEIWFKQIVTKLFYTIMKLITKVNIVPNAGDFRLLDRKVVLALIQCKEKNRFTKGLYAWVGFKSYGVEFKAQNRLTGRSHFGLKKLTELAITGITSFSNIPLRIFSVIGLFIAGLSFLYALFIATKVIIYGIDVPGYASLIIAIIFFGGIQLLSIGILGEYVAKIFIEVKQRPNYIIKNIED